MGNRVSGQTSRRHYNKSETAANNSVLKPSAAAAAAAADAGAGSHHGGSVSTLVTLRLRAAAAAAAVRFTRRGHAHAACQRNDVSGHLPSEM